MLLVTEDFRVCFEGFWKGFVTIHIGVVHSGAQGCGDGEFQGLDVSELQESI